MHCGQHRFREGLGAWWHQAITRINGGSLFMYSYKKFQWNFNQKTNRFVEESAFEKVVCNIILFRDPFPETILHSI